MNRCLFTNFFIIATASPTTVSSQLLLQQIFPCDCLNALNKFFLLSLIRQTPMSCISPSVPLESIPPKEQTLQHPFQWLFLQRLSLLLILLPLLVHLCLLWLIRHSKCVILLILFFQSFLKYKFLLQQLLLQQLLPPLVILLLFSPYKAIPMTCTWLAPVFLMTLQSRLVHTFKITFSWSLAHDLSQLVHELFIHFSRLVHNLFTTVGS